MFRSSKYGDESKDLKSKSRTISKEVLKINQWQHAILTLPLNNKDYSMDVVQIMESNSKAWEAIEEVIESAKESHVVKVITPQVLFDFMNLVSKTPDSSSISHLMIQFALNYIQSDDTYVLTSNFFAMLIKLRIIAFHEEYSAHQEMIKNLKDTIQSDVNKYSKSHLKAKEGKDKKEPKDKKKKKEKPAKEVKEKGGKKVKEKESSIDKIPEKPLSLYDVVIEDIEVQHVYFIICGFYDPTLIKILNDINVNVSAFIEFFLPQTQKKTPNFADKTSNTETEQITAKPSRNVYSKPHYKPSIELEDFWGNWRTLRYNLTKVLPNDTCYIKYNIPTQSGDNEQNVIFNELLSILHNISDLEICYKKYYDNARYLNVEENKIAQLHCMIKYKSLMDQIPNECITIPYLLDSLLNEVCAKVDDYSEPHKQEVKNILKNNSHGGTVFQVKKLLKKYDCTHYKRVQKLTIPRTITLSYGNILYYTTGHLSSSSSIIEISLNMLKQSIPMKLFELIKSRNPQNLLLYNYVFAKWSNQLTHISMQQLMQTVYSFLFSRGNFKKILLNNSKDTNNNSADYFFFGIKNKYKNEAIKKINFQLNPYDLEEGDKNENITKNTSVLNSEIPTVDNYYSLVEELDTSTTIQMINTAYNNYKYFDYKYFAPSDVVLIHFHHNINEYGIKENKQKINLGTTICFRDFCGHFFDHQTSWFVKQMEEYMEEEILINKMSEDDVVAAREKELKDIKCLDDFIIPGSYKDRDKIKKPILTGKSKPPAAQKLKENNKEEDKEITDETLLKMNLIDLKQRHGNVRLSKIEFRKLSWMNFVKPSAADLLQTKFMNNLPHKTIHVSVPSEYSLYDSNKIYDFEIYNLGHRAFILDTKTVQFISSDGILTSMTKNNWVHRSSIYTFKISDEFSTVVLHTNFKNYFIPNKPFYFHLNIVNGTTLVFALPIEKKPLKTDEKKHIVEDELYLRQWPAQSVTKESLFKSELSNISKDISNLDSTEYLKLAIRRQIPIFKIISSKLHKYNYVKRVKSHVEFPIGNVLRRVICKPKLFQRLPKNSKKYTVKCIPFSDLHNKKKPSPGFQCKGTLPTGLEFQTKTDMSSRFYIKQKYIVDRKDIPSVKDEAYRCCLRNGVIIKFMKDGSIKTLSSDKSSSHYQFGYFSSNTNNSSFNNSIGKPKRKRISRIVPLHAYTSDLSLLEKKIRYICNKYKNHLIDIADNYHFESSRLEYRNKQNIYKLSKKLFTATSTTIPIVNQNVITADGDMINIKNNKVVEEKNKYPEIRHKDYLTHETILHREDGISWYLNKNGKTVTQFPDGSRISTWCSILDEHFRLQKRSNLDSSENAFLGTQHSKYSQTNKSESRNIIFSKPKTNISEDFVLIGMNYKFEHPNYATVYYFCEKDTIELKIPDNIKLTVYPEGHYTVKSINDSAISIDNKKIEFTVNPRNTSCTLDLSQLLEEGCDIQEKFLYMKDSSFKEFSIDNIGRVAKSVAPPQTETFSNNSTMINVDNKFKPLIKERLFVLKRNLSGQEYFRDPIPYNFVHTLKNIKQISESKAETNVLQQLVSTKIMSPLKKNYTENLMMLHDIPVLATLTEQKCMDKLWKIHDLDINCFISKREPRFIFQRVIFNLPSNEIMQEIATCVIKCIIDRNDNLPDLNIIRLYKEDSDKHLKPIKKTVKKDTVVEKNIAKWPACNNLTSTYKQLIKNQKIPPYFKTLKGVMFTTIEKCSEGAIKIGQQNDELNTEAVKPIQRSKDKSASSNVTFKKKYNSAGEVLLENMSAPNDLQVKSLSREKESTYPGKLDVPKDLTIHLKPDSKVHEIVLTAKGLKIITETETQDYPFVDQELYPSESKQDSQFKLSQKSSLKQNKSKSLISEQKVLIDTKEKLATPEKILKNSSRLKGLHDSVVHQPETCDTEILNNEIEELSIIPEGSFSNLPSWGTQICERISNIPISNEECFVINENEKCVSKICFCPAPNEDTPCKMCTCPLIYCSCEDTYPWFSICALQNELNISEFISVLAWNIIIAFEKNPDKLDVFELALERVMQSIIEDTELLNLYDAIDLQKTITYILKNKRKQREVIEQEIAINILNDIINEISLMHCFPVDRQSALTKESSKELSEKIANVIIFSKQYENKAMEVINTATHYLLAAKITLQDVITIIKMTEEKINNFYAQKLPDHGISSPVLHADFCNEIINWIKMVVDNILDMTTCTPCQSVQRYTEEGSELIPGIYCSNTDCRTKKNKPKSLSH